jgi:mRNA interferase RelE/StbE
MSKIKMLYEVRQHPSVRKRLKSVPRQDRLRIQQKIESLSKEPRPRSCEKLHMLDTYRLRVGDYRIVYRVDDKNSIVMVNAIGHRSQIYRRRI